ncbi:hypothetical protein TNCT_208371, partial [Trichonephila clavata]
CITMKCCKVILRKACPRSQHQCEKKMPQLQEGCCRKSYVTLQESAKKSNENLYSSDFETDQSTGEHILNFVVSQH